MFIQLQFIRFYLRNFVFQLGFLYLSVESGSIFFSFHDYLIILYTILKRKIQDRSNHCRVFLVFSRKTILTCFNVLFDFYCFPDLVDNFRSLATL